MRVKTSNLIQEYIEKNKRVETKELLKKIKIGKRALYKQLNSLVSKKKISKYGIPPHVIYTPYTLMPVSSLIQNIKQKPFIITKEQQIKELIHRVPPVLNVNIVIYKEGKYLMGSRSKKKDKVDYGAWLYPGGRMRFDETIAECALRILSTEVPGVQANLKRLIAASSDMGVDPRSNNINLYYLMAYESGEPIPNFQLDKFSWFTSDELTNLKDTYWELQDLVDEVDSAVKMMNTTEEEILVEVDDKDDVIGTISKREAHHTSSRFHRAAHIVIFTPKGEIVLHQRSINKLTSPLKWDMFGGHEVSGHTIDQTAYAELAEELGINTPLTFVSKKLHEDEKQREWSYLYYGVTDGPYGFDRNEVAQIKFFDCPKLLAGEYDKDFDILKHVYNYVLDLKPIWSKLSTRKPPKD